MKQLLITIAAVVLVGCGESQQSAPAPEVKPVEFVSQDEFIEVTRKNGVLTGEEFKAAVKPTEPVAEVSQPVPTTVKAPEISISDAAAKGNIEAVKKHLAAGTDVNVKHEMGTTTLHDAAFSGHKETVELLIAKGADLNMKNDFDQTPLDWAIQFKKPEIADLLGKHGGKTGEELKAEGK